MTTVIEQNRNTLREAMVVQCGFSETAELPKSLTPSGELSAYESIANVNENYLAPVLMDLSGEGFQCSGKAAPLKTETDNGYRYGFMSYEATDAAGGFNTAFTVTLVAPSTWEYITIELIDRDGNVTTQLFEPTWNGLTCTARVETFTPNSRCRIIGVHLGKAWAWDSANIVSVELDLRSVATEIGGELEVSTIEIQAYEPTDYADVIGRAPDGAPIWYSAGYDGDMSAVRTFYKADNIEWENNLLTIKGQDATQFLDGKDLYAEYIETTYATVQDDILARLEEALKDVDYTTYGTVPTGSDATAEKLLFHDTTARECVSTITNLYRDDAKLRLTYVDAGIPTLHIGDSAIPTWTIYADEIGELRYEIEPNYNAIEANLYTVKAGSSMSMSVSGTKGELQAVDFDKICDPLYVDISPEPKSFSVVSPYKALLVPAAKTSYTITCSSTLEEVKKSANTPYTVTNSEKGFTYEYEEDLQMFTADSGSLTKQAMADLLDRSNVVYEFTYRGNPHIQPRDKLNVQIASWKSVETLASGLVPSGTQYPSATLYPNATYTESRKISYEWVALTVDSIESEHSEGGFTSTIRARKGAV